jgi:hypothetical protein
MSNRTIVLICNIIGIGATVLGAIFGEKDRQDQIDAYIEEEKSKDKDAKN